MLNDGKPVPVYLEMTEISPNSHWAIKNQEPIPKATVIQEDNGTDLFIDSFSRPLSFPSILMMNNDLSITQIIPMVNITTLVLGDVHKGLSVTNATRRTSFKMNPITIPPIAMSLRRNLINLSDTD